MSKSIPNRTRSPGVEGATIAPSRHAVDQFRLHLLERVPDAARAKLRSINSVEAASGNGLRELWEKSDLPAGIFADEVAGFWKLPRAGLQQLTNVHGAVEHFSPRFLRESSVFPFRLGDDGFGLAVSDPADGAAIRAAEIVCGRPVAIAVASFDDIATILELRLDERTAEAVNVDEPEQRTGDDDIDSLRDLASGAPVVRAVNDVLERAMELRASDIHLEPFRTGLVVRMRVDGILRAVPFPGDAPPQAVVSRIKILAGLNIAERRLPQDGAARARVGRTDIDIRIAT
ncbi:MAG: Flp pilus assembly complex ATPase component TadA, partial [Xanthobacteraceae bacterium]|nr:Flp pilus assembly complex ATPase component TadA [Xanthobacteraceae bacterium]